MAVKCCVVCGEEFEAKKRTWVVCGLVCRRRKNARKTREWEKRNSYKQEWRLKNKERISQKRRRYHLRNADYLCQKSREYYADNKDKINARRRADRIRVLAESRYVRELESQLAQMAPS